MVTTAEVSSVPCGAIFVHDTMESAIEFDELRRVLGEWAGALGLGDDQRPPDGRSPTWLYRQDRWKPESAKSR